MAALATKSRGFLGGARTGCCRFLGSEPSRVYAPKSPSKNAKSSTSSLIWAPSYSSKQQHSVSYFSSASSPLNPDDIQVEEEDVGNNKNKNSVRLSKVLSQHAQNLAISRREAERLIRGGDVTMAGNMITYPHFLVDLDDLSSPGIVQVNGKPVAFPSKAEQLQQQQNSKSDNGNSNIAPTTKVWIVHKLKGEVVAEHDPQGRPSMMQRILQGGVGKKHGGNNNNKKKQQQYHLKPIGRLDIPTEGLILVTNDGQYARDMELPLNQLHRTYRVRVHGPLTQYKIKAMQRGISVTEDKEYGGVVGRNNVTRYSPMKVQLEGKHRHQQQRSTNCWIRITCTEGKNRQIRNVLKHLGLTVTRLIRVSFGDYQLQTIPPGMALEVPAKDIDKQIHKGPLFPKKQHSKHREKRAQQQPDEAPAVQWVRHYR